MFIIGCDFHRRFQQIAMLDHPTGDFVERRSDHQSGQAKRLYETIPCRARAELEATWHEYWSE